MRRTKAMRITAVAYRSSIDNDPEKQQSYSIRSYVRMRMTKGGATLEELLPEIREMFIFHFTFIRKYGPCSISIRNISLKNLTLEQLRTLVQTTDIKEIRLPVGLLGWRKVTIRSDFNIFWRGLMA